MCLACATNIKNPENLKIAEGRDEPAPWMRPVITGKEFGEWCAPDPERIVEFKGLLEIHAVFLHTPENKIIKLTENDIEEITDNALALIVTGTDDWLDIWALQWPNDYIPKIFDKTVKA